MVGLPDSGHFWLFKPLPDNGSVTQAQQHFGAMQYRGQTKNSQRLVHTWHVFQSSPLLILIQVKVKIVQICKTNFYFPWTSNVSKIDIAKFSSHIYVQQDCYFLMLLLIIFEENHKCFMKNLTPKCTSNTFLKRWNIQWCSVLRVIFSGT